MNLYYCTECGSKFNEFEKVDGYTKSEDEYYNDSCPDCGDEEIVEIEENELCPVCGYYHDEDSLEYERCAKRIYTDALGLRYIEGDIKYACAYMDEHEITLREYVLSGADESKAFCEFYGTMKAAVSA